MACKYYINNKVLNEQEVTEYINSNYIKESDIKYTTIEDIANILAYSNSKLILEGYEVEYTTPDNMKFKTYQEASNHISDLARSVEDVDLSYIKETYFKEKEEAYLKFKKEFEENQRKAKETGLPIAIGSMKFSIEHGFIQDIKQFIEKNKEYEQSKEIIEEWKKVNNIQYNPEEIYSRGQGFYSAFAAYSDLDLDTLMANILHHIEDNEKAGGKFALSAFTKPIDKTIRHIEKSGLNFVIYPQPEHIMWAANTDVFSGSVWDASEKVNKDKKSELLGVSYTKYPSLDNINAVQPNLASVVDNLSHHHNELGIQITGNNFRLEINKEVLNETDGQEYYKVKNWVDKINSILDQKYGKLVKPEIAKNKNQIGINKYTKITYQGEVLEESGISSFWINFENGGLKEFNTEKELNDFVNNLSEKTVYVNTQESYKGIQPTKTKDNTTSIESVKNTLGIVGGKRDRGTYNEIDKGTIVTVEGQNGEYYIESVSDSDGEIGIGITSLFYDLYPVNEFDPDTNPNGQHPLFNVPEKVIKIKEGVKKEYTSQALINTKIAALKEVAKKYPRSLIRSEVKPISPFDTSSYSQFNDELPFQKIPNNTEKNIIFVTKEDLNKLDKKEPC